MRTLPNIAWTFLATAVLSGGSVPPERGAATLPATGIEAIGRGSPQEAPLAAFERFLGPWEYSESFLRENDWARGFYAESGEWGGRKNTVRLRETVDKQNPNRLVFEGFAFWHPVDETVKFVGYNVQERFFFEGEYVALEPDRLVRQYRVYYPAGFEHGAFPEVAGRVREYRGERRLRNADTLEIRTYMRIGDDWVRWPAPDAEPFIVTRAR